MREKAIHLTDISSFRGLPLWLACYVVYNRHSEAKELVKSETPADIDHFFAVNLDSIRCEIPIVEQVIYGNIAYGTRYLETGRTD